MFEDITNIFLEQGKQFMSKQKNIEGYTTFKPLTNIIDNDYSKEKLITETKNRALAISTTNYADKAKLLDYKTKLVINRSAITNKYLNRNIRLPASNKSGLSDNGYGGYVTAQGFFKPYKSEADIIGMPFITANANDFDYKSLIQGSAMKFKKVVGNEGKNVYVVAAVENSTATYKGCLDNTPKQPNVGANDVTTIDGITDFNNCQKFAADNGYPVFGMTNASYANVNSAKCVVSESTYDIIKDIYADKTTITEIIKLKSWGGAITSSDTTVAMKINSSGHLSIHKLINNTETELYKIANVVSNCLQGGNIEILSASYDNFTRSGFTNLNGDGDDDNEDEEDDVMEGFKLPSQAKKNEEAKKRAEAEAKKRMEAEAKNRAAVEAKKRAAEAKKRAEEMKKRMEEARNREAAQKAANKKMAAARQAAMNAQKQAAARQAAMNAQKLAAAQQIAKNNSAPKSVAKQSVAQKISQMVSSAQQKANDIIAQQKIKAEILAQQKAKAASDLLKIEAARLAEKKRLEAERIARSNIATKTLIERANGKSTYHTTCNELMNTQTTNFNAAYKCGNKTFTNPTPLDGGQTMIFDCSEYKKQNCSFYLLLQNNGDLCLYRGSEPNDTTTYNVQNNLVLKLYTNTLSTDTKASLTPFKTPSSKYGRPYIKLNESLASREAIYSADGKYKLVMDPTGSLVLYANIKKNGFSTFNNKKYGITDGKNETTTYYSINEYSEQNRQVLGKVAYIDGDSKLREYPSEMHQYSNRYLPKNNFDSPGNDISDTAANSITTQQQCKTACDKNPECAGFVFKSQATNNGKKCFLKNSGMYPVAEAKYEGGSNMSIRMPKIIPGVFKTSDGRINAQCGAGNIIPIYATKYNAYKSGNGSMSPSFDCSIRPYLEPESTNYRLASQRLKNSGNVVSNNIKKIASVIARTNNKNLLQSIDIANTDATNEETVANIVDAKATFNTGKEGLSNISEYNDPYKKNIDDIQAMLSDSDISVLQENYSYIMWSTLAVGLLSVTISSVR